MSIDEFKSWAVANGWTEDRFGHFHKGEYRLKVQARSIRLEKRVKLSRGNAWVRRRSGFLSSLSLDGENKLQGLK